MFKSIIFRFFVAAVLIGQSSNTLLGQGSPQQPQPPRDREGEEDRPQDEPDRPRPDLQPGMRGDRQDGPPFGPGRPGGPSGPGGFGGGPPGGGPPGSQPNIEILNRFDTDQNGWLSDEERKEAKTYLQSEESPRRNRGGFGRGGRPGFGNRPAGLPGEPSGPNGRAAPPDGPAGRPEGPPPEGPGGLRGMFGGSGPGMRGPGGGFPGGPGMMREPGKPGKKIDKSEVQPVEGELYDTSVLRTIFIDFGIEHWEEELELFHGTDVDVVANLTVDGKTYPNVGLRFRGASSYFMVPRGLKRSLNLSVDMADEKQSLQGYKTLNLLNCNGDASMFSSVLYSHIARKYMPAPKANFVRVVINGENWGVFANVEQFNKDFLKHHYGNSKGTRWKVSGSPQGRGGLEYFGGDEEQYKRHFEMKSDDPDSWKDLIHFCKVLNETPPEKLKEAISPLLDLDEALWFLALDNALVNSDGYWVRASDYSLYLDDKKVFHVIPHDMNEAFRPARGPGMGRPGGPGGPGGPSGLGGFGRGGSRPNGQMGRGPEARRAEPSQAEGRERPESERPQSDRPQRPPAENQEDESSDRSRRPNRQANPDTAPTQLRRPGGPGGLGGGQVSDLDPLVGLNSPRMPLRSKLLAVPELREQYLKNVKQIASESLTWSELGPIVETVGKTIEPHVKEDTRKLTTYEAFATAALSKESSLRKFIEGRSKYLLEYQPKK